MKNLVEYINSYTNEENINESISLVDIGVAYMLICFAGSCVIFGLGIGLLYLKKLKSTIIKNKTNKQIIDELNNLLEPYKEQLKDSEWASKLFAKDMSSIKFLKSHTVSDLLPKIENDLKQIMSNEDFNKLKELKDKIQKNNFKL